ncbi:hypothetical protein PSC71_06400 [Devosia sp. J2-20]|uniref:hypothetical protein n=1 Tax=Devosia sp. J2-20 TaxID=3026161 RepID=UPI002499E355|nr:hypothetical protein [Devosia sp. J2-20]WDR00393.1 hypothetical protein PSC71_06400 [Devosia sp. J2-20]
MATLVLFYSATGNTRKAATALAGALGAELCEITCSAYAKGFWGPFRKAYDVLAGRNPPVEIPEMADQVWDMIVLGSPVWGRGLRRPYAAICGAMEVTMPAWQCS